MTDETQETPAAPSFAIPEEYVKDGKILGQFDSPQALLDAYAGGVPAAQEPAPAPVEAPAPAEAPALTDLQIPQGDAPAPTEFGRDNLVELWQESRQEGGLTQERYTELQNQGFSREAVDLAVEGIESRRKLAAMEIATAVGGEERISQAFQWAKTNLTEAQQTAINADLNVASVEGQTAIIQNLIQRSGQGNTPSAVAGTNAPANDALPFQSREQFYAAQANPLYDKDPAYRASVERRLAATSFPQR